MLTSWSNENWGCCSLKRPVNDWAGSSQTYVGSLCKKPLTSQAHVETSDLFLKVKLFSAINDETLSIHISFNPKFITMKFLIAAFCIALLNSVSAQENVTFDLSLDTNNDKCAELNQQRLDMRDCCDYPRIHFFNIFSTHCIDECVGSKDVCCAMVCVWRNTRVRFHEGGLNLDGLKQTLLESVTHKSEWEELISKAVDQCNAEG